MISIFDDYEPKKREYTANYYDNGNGCLIAECVKSSSINHLIETGRECAAKLKCDVVVKVLNNEQLERGINWGSDECNHYTQALDLDDLCNMDYPYTLLIELANLCNMDYPVRTAKSGVKIVEVGWNGDLHSFDFYSKTGDLIGGFTPADLDGYKKFCTECDNGWDPEYDDYGWMILFGKGWWADGLGRTARKK